MEHNGKHSDSGFTAGKVLPSSLSLTVVVEKLHGIVITWMGARTHILFKGHSCRAPSLVAWDDGIAEHFKLRIFE